MNKVQQEAHDFGANLGTLVTKDKKYSVSASYSEDLLRYQQSNKYDKCFELITKLSMYYKVVIPPQLLTLTSTDKTNHEKVVILYAFMMGFQNASIAASKKKE